MSLRLHASFALLLALASPAAPLARAQEALAQEVLPAGRAPGLSDSLAGRPFRVPSWGRSAAVGVAATGALVGGATLGAALGRRACNDGPRCRAWAPPTVVGGVAVGALLGTAAGAYAAHRIVGGGGSWGDAAGGAIGGSLVGAIAGSLVSRDRGMAPPRVLMLAAGAVGGTLFYRLAPEYRIARTRRSDLRVVLAPGSMGLIRAL